MQHALDHVVVLTNLDGKASAGFRHNRNVPRDGNAGRNFGNAGRDQQGFLLGEESAERDAVGRHCAVLVDVESSNVSDPSRANEVAGDLRIGHDSAVIQESAVEAGVKNSVPAVDRGVVVVEGDSGRHYRSVGEGAGSNRQCAGEGGGGDESQQIPNHLQPEGVRGCAGETLDQIDVGAGALLIIHRVRNVLELVKSDLHVCLSGRGRYVAVCLRVVLGGRRRDAVGVDRCVIFSRFAAEIRDGVSEEAVIRHEDLESPLSDYVGIRCSD